MSLMLVCEMDQFLYLYLEEVKNTGGGFRWQTDVKESFFIL